MMGYHTTNVEMGRLALIGGMEEPHMASRAYPSSDKTSSCTVTTGVCFFCPFRRARTLRTTYTRQPRSCTLKNQKGFGTRAKNKYPSGIFLWDLLLLTSSYLLVLRMCMYSTVQ